MVNKWDGHGIMPQFIVSNDGKVNVSVPVSVGSVPSPTLIPFVNPIPYQK